MTMKGEAPESKSIMVRFQPSEKQRLRDCVKALDVSMNEFCRKAILERVSDRESTQEAPRDA